MKKSTAIILAVIGVLLLGAYGVYTIVVKPLNELSESIENAILTAGDKNNASYQQIIENAQRHPGNKVYQKLFMMAATADAKTDSLYNYVQELKVGVIEWKGLDSYESYMLTGELKEPKNMGPSTEMLVEAPAATEVPRGKTLQKRLNRTRNELIALFEDLPGYDGTSLAQLENNLYPKAEDNSEAKREEARTWYGATFNGIPTGAAVALLTMFQINVNNAKTTVHDELLRLMPIEGNDAEEQ